MNTEMENGMLPTLDECMQMTFPQQIVGVSDSHARTSASPEDKQDFSATVRACFSELCTFLDSSKKKRDPIPYSLRMLKICLVLMEDGISPDFSVAWTRVGTMRNGRFSTLKNSEYHRTEKGYSLSDILEDEVDEKYYLSQAQVNKILFA